MKRIIMAVAAACTAWFGFAEPTISDVTARQRYPWNGKVDISYTASGVEAFANENAVIATLQVTAKDNVSGNTYTATNLVGDAALSDGKHKVVWDMNADGLTFVSTDVVFSVSCETNTALYCVLDLSAGSNATNYPASYLAAEPEDGWTDEYKTTKLVMRRIEPGTCAGVTVTEPYYIGVFETTQKQYELMTGSKPSYFSGNDKRPVEQVSYNTLRGTSKGAQYPSSTEVDETSVMGKLRTKTGFHFDLPSEAQWEYACRAGTTTTYSYGDNANGDYMWYYSNSSISTHDVGTKMPNSWGLYDMHGNVWEWCLEWYGSSRSYTSSRVFRGGGCYSSAGCCASNYQYYWDTSSVNYYYVGFRLCMAAPKHQYMVLDLSAGADAHSGSVDLTTGTRTISTPQQLTYSTEWEEIGEEAVAAITANGVELGSFSGEGVLDWTPPKNGTYELKHIVTTNGVQVGETLTATFVAEGFNPDAPIISPASGTTFGASQTITIKCETTGATVYYTTDGSEPTTNSTKYSRFKISGKTTIKAIAYLDGMYSEVTTAEYALGRCDDPVISLADGTTFTHSNQEVSITGDENGVLRYTLDGTEPTAESPVYEGPFTISESTVVKARVFSDTHFDSAVVTSSLTREWLQVETPVITAAESFQGSKTMVTLSCGTEGALIRYTTNGNDPNSHSTKYTGPFEVTASCTIKAYATCDDYLTSEISSFSITKVWCIGDALNDPDQAFQTSGDKGWVSEKTVTKDGVEAMRSGAITHEQKSVMATTVDGKGTVSFWWKTDCEQDPEGKHEWDHAEFHADDTVYYLDGVTDWQQLTHEFTTDGEHNLQWIYVKDDAESEGEDCVYVDMFSWTAAPVDVVVPAEKTGGKAITIPLSWFTPAIQAKFGTDLSAAALKTTGKKDASGAERTVWQEYVAGTDPTDANSQFTAAVSFEDGKPKVTWSPALNGEGVREGVRLYKVLGAKSLTSAFEEVAEGNESAYQFFKVTVEMP